MWPRLSFLAGLSTLRVRYKSSMPLISVMPTCLKTSHLLPRADTQANNQSDQLESSYSHRRVSHSCTVHLVILPPHCRHLIYFPCPLLYLCPKFVTYFMALLHRGIDCLLQTRLWVCYSVTSSLYKRHIFQNDLENKDNWKKSCYPYIERKSSMCMKSWHENRVFGEYANRMRIKQKHLPLPRILCAKF